MAGLPFERLSYDQDYDQALSHLYHLQKFGIKFGLSKTETLLTAFNNPHQALNCIHIAGTNGKGSVAAMLSSIYSRAGYKVGLFTSPHLVDFRERFQINGRMISKAQTLDLIREIKEKVKAEEPPTFFEFVTAMTLIYFFREKVDLAVMEAGLGGRLDATNIIKPLITIITNISLEHQDHLGRTLEKIAREKAGIIKSGVPLVTGVGQKKIQEQIESICRERKVPMVLAGRDFRTRKVSNGKFSYFGFRNPNSFLVPRLASLRLALLGDHQIKNAGLALAVVELLQEKYPVPDGKIRAGLSKVSWPGRMEVLSERPWIVLDGAHNPRAMRVLAAALLKVFSFKKLLIVFGMMKDKNIKQTLNCLIPLAGKIILTRAEYDRSADPEYIKRVIKDNRRPTLVVPDISLAVNQALQEAGPEDLILITGSLFVVGEARAWWERSRRSLKP
ncbi:MAG: folylpolyglutamate synthase/dihydrofolate synthase family protein [Thermodesulfobacteriota bacterium]|jgi:dihydrofolate synthase/folylpolyglutamate synthase